MCRVYFSLLAWESSWTPEIVDVRLEIEPGGEMKLEGFIEEKVIGIQHKDKKNAPQKR